jgi:hypothetical protein
MEPRRYEPPSAPVADVSPEGPGPLPNWAAVVAGLAVDLFLTMLVVWELALNFASVITDDEELADVLSEILDLGFTYGAELFAFWMTLHMCRSRSFRVVSIVAALSWLTMVGDRWVLDDHGFPLWYEISLLFTVPLALATLYARARGFRLGGSA